MKRYGRTNRRALAPRRKPRVKRAPRAKTTLVKTIKRVLHSQIENKEYSTYASNATIYSASATDPNYYQLVPLLNQGTGQNARIGNQVNVVSAKVRGFVNVRPYNAVSNTCFSDVYIKMWVCRRKGTNLTVTPSPTVSDWQNFFSTTGGASIGFQGNMLDMMFYPNSDYWTILATKTVLVSNANLIAGSQATIATTSSGARSSIPFQFDVTKHLGKLTFNDNINAYPSNKELFLVFQAVDSQGTTLGSSQAVAEYHTVFEMRYEDA